MNHTKHLLGTLYLIPTPLDFGCPADRAPPITDSLPASALQRASGLSHWVVEDAKSARGFLKRVNECTPLARTIQQLNISELPRGMHKHGDFPQTPHEAATIQEALRLLLQPCLEGIDVGLLSEAGMPAVADPGALLVRLAHRMGICVEVFSGPSALMMALACSGLNGQCFAFWGYLPINGVERVRRIKTLESLALDQGQTQIFIETPHRNPALRDGLLKELRDETRLAIACGLSLLPNDTRKTHSATVSNWRKNPPNMDWTLPCVYMIGR